MGAMTLIEFLQVQIADDEATWGHPAVRNDGTLGEIAERMLREAGAKRRIVDLHHPLDGGHPEEYPWTDEESGRTYWPECAECQEKHVDGRGCATLRALGLSYADRAGYREEWKP